MNSKNIRCILIDDEPLALEVLKAHLSAYKNIEVVNTFGNGLDALEWLKDETVDAVFTDINMPGLSGLDLVKNQYPSPHAVIFTTAHPNYAADAFEFEALDYLLKPISPDRLEKAVKRLDEYLQLKKGGDDSVSIKPDFVFVKVDGQHQKVNYSDIQYVEAFADYVKIWTANEKRIVTLQTMRNMEMCLPSDLFVRIHRSFIVAKNKIGAIQNNAVMIGGKQLPVGKNYKDLVQSIVQQTRLR
ncbi:MAG: response regulator transcription factor [Sphingomonadales bacterium]|nr:response regulator transcription factor [Sphingomonadales bacterium]